jgi:hypothetical protein
MINRMTGEPILPAQIYSNLARYWFAVCAGKIGSPVMRLIINRIPRGIEPQSGGAWLDRR